MTSALLSDPSRRLAAGELEAIFLPHFGMLGASLRHRGAELLRRVEDLDQQAAKGSTAGIPILYPWANRLSGMDYDAAGQHVALDPASKLLRLDEHGLPIHGVPWPRLGWEVVESSGLQIVSRLEWNRDELLSIFPFRHAVELSAALDPNGLTMETTIAAAQEGPVPVSFGFHPYFGIPELPRGQWRLRLPAMRKLQLDPRGIPTSQEQAVDAVDRLLNDLNFDDGFALRESRSSFAMSGGGRRISVALLEGYPYAQVFAPRDKEYIALEPMSAPTSALTSGRGLQVIQPGSKFTAAFRIIIESIAA